MTPQDFPCFVCGSTGPHVRLPMQRAPGLTDAEWAQQGAEAPPVILCGACQRPIWEPDTGDGLTTPNLTVIPPRLRDLAHQALATRDLVQFVLLADGHYRGLLREANELFLRQRGLWEDVLLAQLRLEQPD